MSHSQPSHTHPSQPTTASQAPRLYALHWQIELRAPWLVHGNDPGAYGLDAIALRDQQGRRILPATLILGRIRETWERSPNHAECARWLGREATGETLQPQRGRLWEQDLIEDTQSHSAPPALHHTITRITIDPTTGAARDAMLQKIEQNQPHGTSITFKGAWHTVATSQEVEALRRDLIKSLSWHTQLGALRSIGFGELKNVELTAKPVAAPHAFPCTPQGHTALPERFTLRLDPLSPLAVGVRRVQDNLFVSADTITGNTLVGALATLWLAHQTSTSSAPPRARPLAAPSWLSAIRVSHAYPSPTNTLKRPSPLPLSWVARTRPDNNDIEILDAIDHPFGALDHGQALPYAPDWKPGHWLAAASYQDWGATERHLRVHTAIERGQAADGKLFAYDMVVPAAASSSDTSPQPENASTCWISVIDLPPRDHPEHAAAQAGLQQLLSGGWLGPIGKNKTLCRITIEPTVDLRWPSKLPEPQDRDLVLLLNSDAQLLSTKQVVETADQPDLHAHYQDAFTELAQAIAPRAQVKVEHLFAQQKWVGGDYQHKRFRSKASTYSPSLLTVAGSVFRLSFDTPEHARQVAKHWLRHGLALPPKVVEQHGNTWDTNPYVPQNGWGEVSINPQTGVAPLPSIPSNA